MASSSSKSSSLGPALRSSESFEEIKSVFESKNLMTEFNQIVMRKLYKYIMENGWETPTGNPTANYVISWVPASLLGKLYKPAYKLSTDQNNAKKIFDITRATLELMSQDPYNRSLKVLAIFLALKKFLLIREECPRGIISTPRIVEIIDETFIKYLPIDKMPISLDLFNQHKAKEFRIYHVSYQDEVQADTELHKLIAKFSMLSPEGNPLAPPTSPATDHESGLIHSNPFENELHSEQKSGPRW